MSVLDQDGFIIDIENAALGCIYFCNPFYEVFKNKTKIKNASILDNYSSKKALCYCLSCYNKIKKYLKTCDTLSGQFFFEARKLLIPHHPKIYDKNNLIN